MKWYNNCDVQQRDGECDRPAKAKVRLWMNDPIFPLKHPRPINWNNVSGSRGQVLLVRPSTMLFSVLEFAEVVDAVFQCGRPSIKRWTGVVSLSGQYFSILSNVDVSVC